MKTLDTSKHMLICLRHAKSGGLPGSVSEARELLEEKQGVPFFSRRVRREASAGGQLLPHSGDAWSGSGAAKETNFQASHKLMYCIEGQPTGGYCKLTTCCCTHTGCPTTSTLSGGCRNRGRRFFELVQRMLVWFWGLTCTCLD